MEIKRLEQSASGKAFADWFRQKALPCRDDGESPSDFADVRLFVYFGQNDDSYDIPRLEAAINASSVDEIADDGDRPATMAEIKAKADDDERSFALVYHLDRAILACNAVRRCGFMINENDKCVWFSAEDVRKIIDYAERKADARDGDRENVKADFVHRKKYSTSQGKKIEIMPFKRWRASTMLGGVTVWAKSKRQARNRAKWKAVHAKYSFRSRAEEMAAVRDCEVLEVKELS